MQSMKINAETVWNNLKLLREKSPLVHNITNYVVMNNTANALLSIGASPVMAHAPEEMEEMVNIASALVINIGTLSEKWIEAMKIAGKTANIKGIPVIFDPVGAGATSFRTNTCMSLLKDIKLTVIRGNGSEIMSLLSASNNTKGVDSTVSSHSALDAAMQLACEYNTIVSVSGASDYITDGKQIYRVDNGVDLMPVVTGLGCTASALTAAFAAVEDNTIAAATHAMAIMGIAGEMAALKSDGPGTLQLHFIDILYNINSNDVISRAKISQYEK